MAGSTKKKAPKRRRRILPKLFMILGIMGLCGILVALFVMEQELNRIGFFNKGKRLPLQVPQTQQSVPPQTSQPSQSTPEIGRPPAPVTGPSALSPATHEEVPAEDRKRLEGLTSSRSAEQLSQDDRKRLEDLLHSR
jgi:hypothetical protein